jgi:hypothetical protein
VPDTVPIKVRPDQVHLGLCRPLFLRALFAPIDSDISSLSGYVDRCIVDQMTAKVSLQELTFTFWFKQGKGIEWSKLDKVPKI